MEIRDIGQLYREFAGRLQETVRRVVACSEGVAEDACQFAWSRLIYHRARVYEETARGWLVRTAIHEAVKLSRRCSRDLSLDAALEQGIDPIATAPEPWELLVQRERVASVRVLADRPQRFVWLHALGLSYAEMAAHERCTTRTVERQLTRARNELRTPSVAA